MKEFIISYIEDNEIGGHKKEILVVGEDFQSCYEEHIQTYPTMVGIVQQFDEEHKTINFLRPNNIQIEKVTDEIFEEEEKKREVYDGWYISTLHPCSVNSAAFKVFKSGHLLNVTNTLSVPYFGSQGLAVLWAESYKIVEGGRKLDDMALPQCDLNSGIAKVIPLFIKYDSIYLVLSCLGSALLYRGRHIRWRN